MRLARLAGPVLALLAACSSGDGDPNPADPPREPTAEQPASTPAAGGSSDPAEEVQAFAIPEAVTIRVDERYLVPAQRASVWASQEGDAIADLELRFDVDRSEILKLAPPHWSAEVEQTRLLALDPDRPVTVLAGATPDLLKRVGQLVSEPEKLGSIATRQGPHGFPMLFDLEMYTFRGLVQGTESPSP